MGAFLFAEKKIGNSDKKTLDFYAVWLYNTFKW